MLNTKIPYLGQKYTLELRHNQKNIIEFSDKFYIATSSTPLIKRLLESWYKQQARIIIQQRLVFLAALSKSSFNLMSISDAKSNWGSCSSGRNLRFNWRLIMAPLEVIDYVIAHELSHLKEMNHSNAFWENVRRVSPLYRQHRLWLKRNGNSLKI